MGDTKKVLTAKNSTEELEQPVEFKEFLERTHPAVKKAVRDFWKISSPSVGVTRRMVNYPDIRLHCRQCEGERTFRSLLNQTAYELKLRTINAHPIYQCGDCHRETKQYALRVSVGNDDGGHIYKYGEYPPFGIPVSNRVLRLFGKDSNLFLKGRQCENLGFGIAAFAYYRRVVENHRSDLFNEIIKVCQTVGAPEELIEELTAAKAQISFSKSMDKIKASLPQGLLIDGHNPLNALHSALSVGLHGEEDDDCLENAQAVRLVLSDLVDRIALLKQDNKQLTDAVQRLLAKK